MSGFELFAYILIFFFTLTSIGVVIEVCLATLFQSPSTVLKAILSSSIFAVIGYLRNGYVSIELVLFGITGILVYLGYLLIFKPNF